MYKIQHLKSYFVLFYLCGVSSYTPWKRFNQKKQFYFKILKFFPKILHFLLIFISVIHSYSILNLLKTPSVEIIFLITITATHCAVYIDDLSSVRKIRRMLLVLFQVFDQLTSMTRESLCLKTFERDFRFKLFVSVELNFFLFMLKLMIEDDEISAFKHLWFLILTVCKLIALFQAIFFIEFLNFILCCLNQELKHSCRDLLIESNVEVAVNKVQIAKKIHLKMCKIVQLISSRFGWFMSSLLLESIVMPCISLFFVFIYLTGPIELRYKTYRNYNFYLFTYCFT